MTKTKWRYLKFLILKLLILLVLGTIILILGFAYVRTEYVNSLIRPKASFPLTLQWQTTLGKSTYERPAYHNGYVLLPAVVNWTSTRLFALEAGTGNVAWSQSIKRYSFTQCLINDYLVLSGSGPLAVLRVETGEIVWKKGALTLSSNL